MLRVPRPWSAIRAADGSSSSGTSETPSSVAPRPAVGVPTSSASVGKRSTSCMARRNTQASMKVSCRLQFLVIFHCHSFHLGSGFPFPLIFLLYFLSFGFWASISFHFLMYFLCFGLWASISFYLLMYFLSFGLWVSIFFHFSLYFLSFGLWIVLTVHRGIIAMALKLAVCNRCDHGLSSGLG